MSPLGEYGTTAPLLVMLHWLGGSSQTWTEVSRQLASQGVRCVGIDLPGFGDSEPRHDFDIARTVPKLIDTIRKMRSANPNSPWLLAGHSMGGKFGAIIARHAEDGAEGLTGLQGIVLLSPSPAGPEPMDEHKRQQTIQTLGQRTLDRTAYRKQAEKFVDDNTGKLPLRDTVKQRTVADLLRMDPDALVAWMTTGSKEDWSGRVGVIMVPTLILSGTEEQALGPDAQQNLTLPHFANATLVPLEGGGHLAPLERPWEVADRIIEFVHQLGLLNPAAETQLDENLSALIISNRTSSQTREVMLARLQDRLASPALFTDEERRTLRALASRIIPNAPFNLATRLENRLSQPQQDGWRFNILPSDLTAWKQGLASLNTASAREFGVPFIALDPARQDDLLQQAQTGKLGKGLLGMLHLNDDAKIFTSAQMRDWFEDVRGEFAKLYIADPRTMHRIGFTGFADEQGFTHITLAARQELQP